MVYCWYVPEHWTYLLEVKLPVSEVPPIYDALLHSARVCVRQSNLLALASIYGPVKESQQA